VIEPEREVTVRVQDLRHGAGACVVTRRWPLRTLVAYLFDGRECDDVRALLAAGAAAARGDRLTWPPIELTAEELSGIERTFPPARPERPLLADEVAAVALHVVGPARTGIAAIPRSHPLVSAAAARASYVRFDYGPWADIFSATLALEEGAAWLAAVTEPSAPPEEIEVVVVPALTASPWVDLILPRDGERAPWRELPP
jgi:hypothetical protein